MPFDIDRDIVFKQTKQKPKTKVYEVWNIQTNFCLGEVKWYPAWRHYCFFPMFDTVFSDRCLLKVSNFVKLLNDEHGEQRRLKAR